MPAAALGSKDLQSLVRIVGHDHVSASDLDRLTYCRDAMSRSLIQWRKGRPRYLPQAVVWPKDTQEVSQVVRWAARRHMPVIPYGGGSGVSGGTLPIRGGVIIDLKRMNQLESIDEGKGSAVVQSGLISAELESQLNAQSFTLGHFPSSIHITSHGGCLAARGAGQLSSKYGKIEDMVEAIEVVLPSGSVLPLDAKKIPNFPGMAPLPLFVGSEGTLGIITRSRMRVHRRAEAAHYRAFSFVRMKEACWAIRTMMQAGLRPSVVRLYDPLDSLILQWGYERSLEGGLSKLLAPVLARFKGPVGLVKNRLKEQLLSSWLAHPSLANFLVDRLPINSILVLGFEGDPEIIAAEEAEAVKICRKVLSRDEGREVAEHWLAHRYSVSYKMPEIFSAGSFVDTIEVATTWDRLAELYREVRRAMAPHCLVLAHFSHAYPEGCSIYFTIVGSKPEVAEELELYDRTWDAAMKACLTVGGTISHHHGVGLLKARYIGRELGSLMDLFRQAKKKLDPHNIMNPGKMGL